MHASLVFLGVRFLEHDLGLEAFQRKTTLRFKTIKYCKTHTTELRLTDTTLKRSLARVNAHVFFQVVRPKQLKQEKLRASIT